MTNTNTNTNTNIHSAWGETEILRDPASSSSQVTITNTNTNTYTNTHSACFEFQLSYKIMVCKASNIYIVLLL